MAASRRPQMTDEELTAILSQQIADSVLYESQQLGTSRRKALRYFIGEATLDGDVPPMPNRSSVVSKDVADVHGWLMPSLIRTIAGGERIVMYEARTQGKEEEADAATEYVNYVFRKECSGYNVLRSAMWDGLLYGNGILKHWWDDTPEYRTETLTGQPEKAFFDLAADPNVEFLEHRAYPDPTMGPMPPTDGASSPAMPPMGQPAPPAAPPPMATLQFPAPMLYDLKIRRRLRNGRLRVVNVPHAQFRIDREALALDEEHVRFCADISLRTRSELVADGYDRELVDSLPADTAAVTMSGENALRSSGRGAEVAPDASTELVAIWECFVQLDYDGDGIAEWRRVVVGGAETTATTILHHEEWGGDLPYSDLVPDPMPHQWQGNTLFDKVGDLQRIKTVFWRGINDNLYWVNNPREEVVKQFVDSQSWEELNNPSFGGKILVSQAGAVRPLDVPFVADKLSAGLDLCDKIREFRTGVSPATMALDPQALVNQTATAVNAAQNASYAMVETMARNIAEGGLQRMFSCILRLVCENQDEPRMLRLRGKWVQFDPRGWDADMDVTINVGLGTGSRDRDLAMLNVIAGKQEQVAQALTPVVAAQFGIGPSVLFETYRKMADAAGLKNPESFFPAITKDDEQRIIQQIMQAQSQPPQPQPGDQAALMLAQSQSQLNAARAQLTQSQAALTQAQARKTLADTASGGQQARLANAQAVAGMLKSRDEREMLHAQIENLRAETVATMAKAGAAQGDAFLQRVLSAIEAADQYLSLHEHAAGFGQPDAAANGSLQ